MNNIYNDQNTIFRLMNLNWLIFIKSTFLLLRNVFVKPSLLIPDSTRHGFWCYLSYCMIIFPLFETLILNPTFLLHLAKLTLYPTILPDLFPSLFPDPNKLCRFTFSHHKMYHTKKAELVNNHSSFVCNGENVVF